MRDAQDEQATKTIEETQKQIQAYYSKAMRRIIAEFEATYDKLLNTAKDGKPPTVADLYKLDKYWQLQGQLRAELQKMGDKETVLLAEQFEKTFQSVYNSLALSSQKQFSQMSKENVKQMISQIWCADGKSWSQRVWNDTERLQQSLNDRLIDCVITGKKTTQLNKFLQEEFNVSYNRADTIIRTEIAHIQTQAARVLFIHIFRNYYIIILSAISQFSGLWISLFSYAALHNRHNTAPAARMSWNR